MISPVTPEPRSESKYKADFPTSSIVTFRLSGELSSFHFNMYLKSPMPEAAKVLMGPADIALTLMLSLPKSSAKYFTEASNAAFATPITL